MLSQSNAIQKIRRISKLMRLCGGGLLALVFLSAFFFVPSTTTFARPIPPGGDGGVEVSPAQQCLHSILRLDDRHPFDQEHSVILALDVRNACGIPVKVTEFEIYYNSSCPSTNEPEDSIENVRVPYPAIVADGESIELTDIHTTHCVECNSLLRPSGWPSFTITAVLLDVFGTNADRNDGPDVFSAPNVQGDFTYSLSNGPSAGDAQRCLGMVP